jgi:hypothetical protein
VLKLGGFFVGKMGMATTDYSALPVLQDAISHTFNSLQRLVMAMAKFQKNRGRKTLFGRDKGRAAWEAFEQELRKTKDV